jgi:hypothetical protein
MSTEQDIGVSVSLLLASSVIREEPRSLRYFSLSGFWIVRKSALMLPASGVAYSSNW